VVLFGSAYWNGLLSWIRDAVLAGGKIAEHDLRLFHVTDSPADVVRIVTSSQNSLAPDQLVSDEIRLST
jgi:predicted Rossmann-fold nucleotide-binding protein